MKSNASERYKGQVDRKYLLDKILHNRLRISEKTLRTRPLSNIFLVRNHNDTLKSIIRLYTSPGAKPSKFANEEGAAEYYIKRLSKLKEYSRTSKGKNIFIKSESLINKTEETFELLSDYLNLKEELSSSYNTFQYTGIPRYGDPSEYINSGKIVRNRNHKDIEISTKTSLICEKAYNECCVVLTENSIHNI